MEISAKIVKELREKTGAGMMDCKNALKETSGEFEKAIAYLRQKGLASADKKLSRQAKEGIIEAYIHTGSKLAVLVEVNCETDFVARRHEFQELAKNIAMQIAASPSVIYVSYDDIVLDLIEREKEIEMGKEDIQNKPKEMKEKIVQGRVEKTLRSLCLFDQPFIKNQDITVEELIKQTVALLGESIKVSRFTRYVLGQYN
jgi:elongation factor Ts